MQVRAGGFKVHLSDPIEISPQKPPNVPIPRTFDPRPAWGYLIPQIVPNDLF